MEPVRQAFGRSVRMGEMQVGGNGDTLRTLLGSCIGLALYDRRRKIGGLAHIVLPESRGKTERLGKYIDTAIPGLIAKMQTFAGENLKLTAKIAGGASMFSTSGVNNIGQQNIEACQQLLTDFRIPLLASHCGGERGRRMSFDIENGTVVIEVVGQYPTKLG
ncbi:chemotaxis protein CheD [Novipirellula sp. SH528]|uniref:chemotaxis protein CheD n=1 Tax=Novipirellula sp. SH528 TaxID=3454466 RepID=UPI003F9F3441